MYLKFYGFKEKPFQIVPNPRYLYRSEKHKKALSYLQYGLREDVGIILLTGEVGSGKTTLIQFLCSKLNQKTEVAAIFNTHVSSAELMHMILENFKLTHSEEKADNIKTLNTHLTRLYRNGKRALLIIDEGQNLEPQALEEIRMLSNFQTRERMLLQIMLVGQPELVDKLRHPSMRQFVQRIAVKYHLTGLNRSDTSKYIAYRMMRAGGKPDLFTKAAVDLIYDMSEGMPRTINLACQSALLYGFIGKAKVITQDIINRILDDNLIFRFNKSLNQPEASKAKELSVQPPHEINDGLHQRVDKIEDNLESFKDSVHDQLAMLGDRLEAAQNGTTARLQKLFDDELKKHLRLVEAHAQLKLKYKALLELTKNKKSGGFTLIK
jgi:general secretion pathway protein A